jgi:hypothetical protein
MNMNKLKYFLCFIFGHVWDRVNTNDMTYYCKRCNRGYRGILPRGKFYRHMKWKIKL